MNQNNNLYMIRRKTDGLYSKGGSTPLFTKKGKIWHGIGPLKLHLGMLVDNPRIYSDSYEFEEDENSWKEMIRINVYKDCEIVEYESIDKNSGKKIEVYEDEKPINYVSVIIVKKQPYVSLSRLINDIISSKRQKNSLLMQRVDEIRRSCKNAPVG